MITLSHTSTHTLAVIFFRSGLYFSSYSHFGCHYRRPLRAYFLVAGTRLPAPDNRRRLRYLCIEDSMALTVMALVSLTGKSVSLRRTISPMEEGGEKRRKRRKEEEEEERWKEWWGGGRQKRWIWADWAVDSVEGGHNFGVGKRENWTMALDPVGICWWTKHRHVRLKSDQLTVK